MVGRAKKLFSLKLPQNRTHKNEITNYKIVKTPGEGLVLDGLVSPRYPVPMTGDPARPGSSSSDTAFHGHAGGSRGMPVARHRLQAPGHSLVSPQLRLASGEGTGRQTVSVSATKAPWLQETPGGRGGGVANCALIQGQSQAALPEAQKLL